MYYDLLPDGLHPSTKGYAVWSQALQPALDQIFGVRDDTVVSQMYRDWQAQTAMHERSATDLSTDSDQDIGTNDA